MNSLEAEMLKASKEMELAEYLKDESEEYKVAFYDGMKYLERIHFELFKIYYGVK